jgi:putative phosphoribosyl transferase
MNRPSGFLRRTSRRIFRDRREAGAVLAEELAAYRDKEGLLVLGLARGGVPVGWEVAAALHAELDVLLVRKLGVPQWSELAMGALASGGVVVMNDNVVSSLHISDEQVRAVIDRETAELDRREHAYRGGRPVADPRDKTVILVDDGIATGASMLAGVRALRASNPEAIVVHQVTDDEVRELLATPTSAD